MTRNTTLTYDIITPSKGKWLFNGDCFSDGLYAPKGADLSDWKEVDNDFKKQWEAEHPIEEPKFD